MSIKAESSSGSGSGGGTCSGGRAAGQVTAESMTLSIAAAALACTLGTQLASAAGQQSMGLAVMAVLASCIAALGGKVAAWFGSRRRRSDTPTEAAPAAAPVPFAGAEALGGALMLTFFASIGAAAGSLQSLGSCGWLFLFILLQLR